MSSSAWDRFAHDPRSPRTAALRASDRDRDVALDVLGEAFADGRLDREEYDARAAAVTAARTLGDLVEHLSDLVPDPLDRSPVVRHAAGLPVPTDVHEQAVRRWAKDRREALTGLVGLSLITWTIWAVTMLGGFPWPLFPVLAAVVNLLRIQMQKQDIVEDHERSLLKRQAKELERRQRDSDA